MISSSKNTRKLESRPITETDLEDRTRYQVLVVDDDRQLRSLFSRLIKTRGYTVLSANDGQEGLEMYKDNPGISLVVSDLNMPGMDGYSLLDKIQEYDNQANVVIITGRCTQENSLRLMEKGAKEVIGKPFNPKKIYELLETYASE